MKMNQKETRNAKSPAVGEAYKVKPWPTPGFNKWTFNSLGYGQTEVYLVRPQNPEIYIEKRKLTNMTACAVYAKQSSLTEILVGGSTALTLHEPCKPVKEKQSRLNETFLIKLSGRVPDS